MNNNTYDIAIVGYGPVGQLLSLIMGRQGYRVAVFERWESLYPLPRAVFHDHEIRRILRMLNLEEDVAAISHPSSLYQWFNAQWKMLVEVDWASESISDGPFGYFFNQPELEAIFDKHVKALPNVQVHQGWEVKHLTENEETCELVMVPTVQRDNPAAPSRSFRARYVVGADGANSTIRQACGIEWLDLGFAEDWLVVDVKPHPGVQMDVPEAAQWCNPERPTTMVPGGPGCRRWEFMRLPHESLHDLQSLDKVWELLQPWATPDIVDLVRHAVYQFRSRIAATWRKGRVVLAGDAAHLMPPFMGQGMCSGLRDVWNLSWRLDRVLRGDSTDDLLDDYTTERKPQIQAVIEASIAMGRVVCVADPQQAQARDNAYFNGDIPPLPPFPGLTGGLIYPARNSLSGQLFLHGAIRRQGKVARFDDAMGRGFHLILSAEIATVSLLAEARELMTQIGGTVLVIADTAHAGDAWEDVSGKYGDFMRAHDINAVLMRPDFYLYGAVKTADEALMLLRHLRDNLSLMPAAVLS
ncbi:bifunctional 3-(3-hydroxy-phenyl)propionate/3-hydroxycinnamic acid hydroxylase [Enterobacteriaceae bacterium H18W14]|uniref:bifunctional 3-(3-hydroxy-phenyl)propionate/3-hydroxycinnamic acid hydroxylase MhpA n=1 Tax=Dryocola boscaweniae TaxID=2925397 RepID=UPI0022F0327D|nr:bifunctional 3-(3-hydroxy-phenyl)propionate/3-hydroxycinnamic acid hydroxylase [Dryocola boscaweniae]MCT4714110.1 bifunctional 3-(3-hydroxy-phenyl)propionate/3-hydroxycinnamic acid hydroxylase [Dryocola boscaweniae]